MDPNCRSEVDWNHMCDYWGLEKTKKYSGQKKVNRGKQVVSSRGGSRSIANHTFHMTNRETSTPPSPFEVYYKLHYNTKKQEWQSDEARIQYVDLEKHKAEAAEKLNSEGTTITTAMLHELEDKAIESVCAKEKTTKSGWKVCAGPGFRKKDYWITSETGSSQQPSSETEELKNQVALLQEELKQRDAKYDQLSMFISSKFPDFESSICAPTSSGVNDSDEQPNDSDSPI